MSHSFSFLVSRNTQLNKTAMGCLLATFCRPFWRLFVVLLMSTLSTFIAPLDGVSWRHLTTSFCATYRRPYNVEFNDVFWRLLSSSNTQFTMAWRHWRSSVTHSLYFYSTCCSIRRSSLRLVGRLYTFTLHNKFNLEARGPI